MLHLWSDSDSHPDVVAILGRLNCNSALCDWTEVLSLLCWLDAFTLQFNCVSPRQAKLMGLDLGLAFPHRQLNKRLNQQPQFVPHCVSVWHILTIVLNKLVFPRAFKVSNQINQCSVMSEIFNEPCESFNLSLGTGSHPRVNPVQHYWFSFLTKGLWVSGCPWHFNGSIGGPVKLKQALGIKWIGLKIYFYDSLMQLYNTTGSNLFVALYSNKHHILWIMNRGEEMIS